MRYSLMILSLLLSFSAHAQSQPFQGKTWAYKKLAIISGQDTLVIFQSDSTKNRWYLGRVTITLQTANKYTGTNVKGQSKTGSWRVIENNMIIDADTNQIVAQTSGQFSTTATIHYRDTVTYMSGKLYTVFMEVPPIISSCETINSGDWRNPAVWSCGREPRITDVVIINLGHTITITSSNAQAQRLIHNGGKLWFTTTSSKLFVKNN